MLAFLQDTQPNNTYFKVKEKEEGVCEGDRKGGRPERMRTRDTDRQANRLTETESGTKRRKEIKEREKEREKVGDIDSKMSK